MTHNLPRRRRWFDNLDAVCAERDATTTAAATTDIDIDAVAYSHSPEANLVLEAAGSLDGRLPFITGLPEQIAQPLAQLLQNVGDAMNDASAEEVEHPNHIPSARWLVHPLGEPDPMDAREDWTDALRLARALLGRPDPNAASTTPGA